MPKAAGSSEERFAREANDFCCREILALMMLGNRHRMVMILTHTFVLAMNTPKGLKRDRAIAKLKRLMAAAARRRERATVAILAKVAKWNETKQFPTP